MVSMKKEGRRKLKRRRQEGRTVREEEKEIGRRRKSRPKIREYNNNNNPCFSCSFQLIFGASDKTHMYSVTDTHTHTLSSIYKQHIVGGARRTVVAGTAARQRLALEIRRVLRSPWQPHRALLRCGWREYERGAETGEPPCKNIHTRPHLLSDTTLEQLRAGDRHGNNSGRLSYLSVIVDLRFLLDVGVELRDIRHVAVRLLAVGVPVTVYRGHTERQTRPV